jgi:hypothetical protein
LVPEQSLNLLHEFARSVFEGFVGCGGWIRNVGVREGEEWSENGLNG